MVIPHPEVDIHALLTRAPLIPKDPFDLHVLGLPPAFVLSQDQTLKLTCNLQILKPGQNKSPNQAKDPKILFKGSYTLRIVCNVKMRKT